MCYEKSFGEMLTEFVKLDGRRARQLARASAEQFGAYNEVSHVTISRWLRGKVKKPRAWQDVVKLAAVLRLDEADVDELLCAAGHEPIVMLRKRARGPVERDFFFLWNQTCMPAGVEPPFQVPPERPYFVDREVEVAGLTEALLDEGSLVCLQGMGGVGKTTLAIHLAYEFRDYFSDGVLWCQLDRADTMSVLSAFASSLGSDVSQYTDLSSRSSKVRELLAHKRLLMVLDDAESDEQIRPLLPPCGLCAVIITTRRHDLSVTDHGHSFEIGPFSEQKGALALFEKILGESGVQKEQAAILEISQLLGHLPLAIVIAANRIKHEPSWSVSDFLARVRNHQKRLSVLARGDLCIQVSFDLSFQALSAAGQRFFAMLGLFEGQDFSVAAAAYVTELPFEEAQDELRHLYNLSLLQLGRHQRYKLHPLLRDFSRKKLIERAALVPSNSGAERQEARKRMVSFFVDLIVQHQKDYAVLDLEIDHLFAALTIAFEQQMKAMLVRGATTFYDFLQARGLYQQAKLQLERAEQAAQEMGDLLGLAEIWYDLGLIARKQGEYAKAKKLYHDALSLARQTDKHEQQSALLSAVLTSLGALSHREGDFAAAQAYYEEAMNLAKEIGNHSRIAALLTNLGLIAADQGKYEEAESSYQEALQLARQVGNKRGLISTLLQNLGQLMDERGDYAQAKQHFIEGLDLAEQLGDPELKSRLLGNLGLVACALGNYAEGAAHFRTGLNLAEQNGLSLQITRQLANLGKVERLRRNYQQANLHYNEALAQCRQTAFPLDTCAILNQLGECYRVQEKWRQADEVFREALQTARQGNYQQQIAKSLEGLARLAAKRGNVEEAHRFGKESQQLFERIGHKRASEVKWWLKELPGVVG